MARDGEIRGRDVTNYPGAKGITGKYREIMGFEAFEKVFGPLKEIYMDTLKKEGYIGKKLTSKRNPDWIGFTLQGDSGDRVFSTTLNDMTPPDVKKAIQQLDTGSHVEFEYSANEGKDARGNAKTYYNIQGVEIIHGTQDDLREPESTTKPSTQSTTYGLLPKDVLILIEVALKEANSVRTSSFLHKESDCGTLVTLEIAEEYANWMMKQYVALTQKGE